MSKKLIFVAIALALLALPLVACARPAPTPTPTPTPTASPTPTPSPTTPGPSPTPSPTPAQTGQVFTLNYDWQVVHGKFNSAVMIWAPEGPFTTMLWERSNGQIKLKYTEGVYKTTEVLPAVQDGRIDIGFYPTSHMSGTHPILNWDAIPATGNLWELYQVSSNPKMIEFEDKFYAPLGVKFLATTTSSPNNVVFSNVKVDAVDKFKGLKARTSGILQTKTMEALGASAMTITEAPEVALKTGIVDAVVTGLVYGWQIGLPDIAKYAAFWPITPGYWFQTVINGKKFSSMPSALQKVVFDTAQEAARMQFFAQTTQLALIEKAISISKMELVYPTAAEQAKAAEMVKSVRQEYLKLSGPDGQKVLDIIDQALASYRANTLAKMKP